MSVLQLFKRKKPQVERLPRVLRAMELLISEQGARPGDQRERQLDYEFDHMKESVQYAKILAKRRRIDPDMAAIACAMQNAGSIVLSRTEGHAEAGYPIVKQMLLQMRCFEPIEVEQIACAVRRHSSKDKTDTPLDELVKDVDIYVRYLDGDTFTRPDDIRRLNALKVELHISA